MNISEQIKPLINEDTDGTIKFDLVTGGVVIITKENVYIIEETFKGTFKAFKKVETKKIDAVRAVVETNLSKTINMPLDDEDIEDIKSDTKKSKQVVKKFVESDEFEIDTLYSVLTRNNPATKLEFFTKKMTPTVYLDAEPLEFLNKFLSSEIYREDYIDTK